VAFYCGGDTLKRKTMKAPPMNMKEEDSDTITDDEICSLLHN